MQLEDTIMNDAELELPTFPTISPSISTERMMKACVMLSDLIQPEKNLPDDDLLERLWFPVERMLRHDKKIQRAPIDEFLRKVKDYPEDVFISKVKDTAKAGQESVTNWGVLFGEDVFYCNRENQNQDMYVTEGSVRASMHAWNHDFKGKAAIALFGTISDLLNPKVVAYARSTCIVNSSGTGKSRMVDELSTSIITIPMCLRSPGSLGFPPPDINLREYFERIRMLKRQDVSKALHGIIFGLLTVACGQLDSFTCDIKLPIDSPDEEVYITQVIMRQRQLASAFRDFMTIGQSFKNVNDNRKSFYGEVIKAATKFIEHCASASEPPTSSRLQFVDKSGKGVRSAAKALHDLIDPLGLVMKSDKWRRPLIILSFDEPHVLTDGTKEGEWSPFSELRRILQRLDNNLIFSLFLSTAGNFPLLSPDINFDPSNRVKNETLRPFYPITEVSFDCLAYPAGEGTMTLDRVVEIGWIAHLGRPLFGSHFDSLPGDDKEGQIIEFAKQKLLGGKEFLEEADSSGSLACLATRFGLEFNEDEDSRDVSHKLVERHMRICIAATTGFKSMTTCSSSEPLLAEAASQLMSNSTSSPVKHLANHTNLYCVDRGRRGELIAALIIMQARDAIQSRQRWVYVMDFIRALLPSPASENFLNSTPTRWRKGEGSATFREIFANCRLWFNHVIKVEDGEVIKPDFLWMFVTRGAMIVCKDNQQGIDIILPLVWPDGNLGRQTVSPIVIQVKNAIEFGVNVDTKIFDAMDPNGLGLLSDNPRPIIRMVFALASTNSGISFPAPSEPSHETQNSNSDKFTAYDIWCAGLESFRQIGDVDLTCYRKLLDRTRQSRDMDAFDLNDPHNPLSETTKIGVGETRRSKALLIKYRGHNEMYRSTG